MRHLSKIYLQRSTCIPSTTIRGAGQHSFNTCVNRAVTCLYLSTMYLVHRDGLNVRPSSQPIAGSMQVNRLCRWPNTNPTVGLLYTLRQYINKHMVFTQCCLNVDPQSLTLAQHWNSIGWLSRVYWNCGIVMWVTLPYPVPRMATTQITQHIGPMLM